MNIDTLAQKFFDFGDKGVFRRERDAVERDVRSLETASQWRNVIGLGSGYALSAHEVLPEVIDSLSLCDTIWGKMSIEPGDSCISI
jgi:hypothetical protein